MNKRIFKDETSEYGDIPFYKIGTFGGTADSFITKEKLNRLIAQNCPKRSTAGNA